MNEAQITCGRDEICPLDIIVVLAESWKLLVLGPFVAGVLAVVLGVLWPQKYEAVAVVRLSEEELVWLTSPTVLDPVVDKFDLLIKVDGSRERAREVLANKIRVTHDKKLGQAILTFSWDTYAHTIGIAEEVLANLMEELRPKGGEKDEIEQAIQLNEQFLLANQKFFQQFENSAKSDGFKTIAVGESGQFAALKLEILKRGHENIQLRRKLQIKGSEVYVQRPSQFVHKVSPKLGIIFSVVVLFSEFSLLVFVFLSNAWRGVVARPDSKVKLLRIKKALGANMRAGGGEYAVSAVLSFKLMLTLFVSFVASFIVTLLVIRYDHLHGHLTSDYDMHGVQKFHVVPVPRIGGVGVFVGVLIALAVSYSFELKVDLFGLLLCGAIVLVVGLVEDFTKKVGVKERLLATAVAGLCGGFFLDGWLTRLDIPMLDWLLAIPVLSVAVTCFAISGVANAYNIIDGYNGLVGVVSIIVLLGLAYVADQVADAQITMISLAMVGSIGGFLVWNFPKGLIFLGDGGAYFVGFMVAELSILLVARNLAVSPWFPLLLSFYPIFETLFSIYRKKIKRGMSPGVPDGLHLHMLIYRRAVRWAIGADSIQQKTTRNALTAPYLWLLSSFAVIPAVLFWDETFVLLGFIIFYALLYITIYRMITKMKIPNWFIIRNR